MGFIPIFLVDAAMFDTVAWVLTAWSAGCNGNEAESPMAYYAKALICGLLRHLQIIIIIQ